VYLNLNMQKICKVYVSCMGYMSMAPVSLMQFSVSLVPPYVRK